ncbi:hypothetical protein AB1Y20_022144 [Prymnesium parvum]|uniref:Uncharacterized protein n=1 Tax=Prymnesium parvum TaxID=97485 RepID=A0AB34JHY9_PRYPA
MMLRMQRPLYRYSEYPYLQSSRSFDVSSSRPQSFRSFPSMKTPAPLASPVLNRVFSAACAIAVATSPFPAPAATDSLLLNDFERRPLVEEGLRKAGLSSGDNRMVTLWARLKAQELSDDATAAAAAATSSISKYQGSPDLAESRMRVRSLQAYLDELQRDIFASKQTFVQGYLGVFYSQRDAFQALILTTFPADDPVSLASKDAMVDEGNNVFKYAEDLSDAISKKSRSGAVNAYARLALAYDRFLKAGDLYGQPPKKVSAQAARRAPQGLGLAGAAAKQVKAELELAQIELEDKPEFLATKSRAKVVDDATAKLVPQKDPLTSTEALYKDTPLRTFRYSSTPPKLAERVLVLAGPDKGRTGVVLNLEGNAATGTAIIKLDTKEVKVIDRAKIARAALV